MTTLTETVSLVRDNATNDLYFQVSQAGGDFYLCDNDGDKVDLASWALVKTIGEAPADDSDAFFALVEPYLAGLKFLAAWEAAGRPQVQEIRYPSQGNATHHSLSHGDVIATAGMTCPMAFKSEHGFVELGWTFEPTMAEGVSSWSKLIFEGN